MISSIVHHTPFQITGNEFGVEGAKVISEVLRANTSLAKLDLDVTQSSSSPTLFIATFFFQNHRE